MRLTLIQTDIIWADKHANLKKTETQLSLLAQKTDLAILPEMFTTGFCTNRMDLAEPMHGKTIQTIKEWAMQFDMAISGSFMATENGKIYNRAFFVFPDGIIYTADKRHLFSMGKEDAFFAAGNNKLIVNYKGFNIFVLVCYDIRFPVWSRNVNDEYDLLIYVANFPDTRIHVWDTLLKARAIENQAYVCGVNRIGKDNVKNSYSGHSTLIDAKGQALCWFEEHENSTKTTKVSREELNQFREKFAVWRDADKFMLL